MKKSMMFLFVSVTMLFAETYAYKKVKITQNTFYGYEGTVHIDDSKKGILQIESLWEKMLNDIYLKNSNPSIEKIYVVYEGCTQKTCSYFIGTKVPLNTKQSVTKSIATGTYLHISYVYNKDKNFYKDYKHILKQAKGHNNKRIIEVHPLKQLIRSSYLIDIYLSRRW